MTTPYNEKKDCCGCGLCEVRCQTRALSMEPDEEGFLYPAVDSAACIECGFCIKLCPVVHAEALKQKSEPGFYAARHKSEEVLMHSTSGGAFTALSDVILKKGGTVFGADFDSNLHVIHCAAHTAAERDRMRVSKYVQSDMRIVFSMIGTALVDGPALFTGTPCQCAAIRSFFNGREPDGLYVCDVLCHSVPSPLVWEAYKRLLEEEKGAPLTHVQFRSKKYEWSRDNSNKGFIYTTSGSDEQFEDSRYYDLFVKKRVISRPACAACRFTDVHRASDITIADCWGIEKHAPELYDARGVSLVMTNSSKGAALLKEASASMDISERPKEEITAEQQRLSFPAPFPPERRAFWDVFKKSGLKEALKETTAVSGADIKPASDAGTDRQYRETSFETDCVLIADSDPLELSLLQEALSADYNIETAENSVKVLEKLRSENISLLVCADADVVMPAKKLLAAIHAEADLAQTPILLITQENDADIEDIVFDFSAGDVVSKPIDLKMFMKRVRNIFNIRNAAQISVQNQLYAQQLQQQQLVLRIMEHDELTGLYNRQAFYRYVREKLDANHDKKYMIVRWDIDQFASFNDSAGIAEGDRLLRELGEELIEGQSGDTIYARLESDNFVMLAEEWSCFPENMLRRLSEWSEWFAADYTINWRIGVYHITDPDKDPALMCDYALLALRSTEKSYTNRIAVYDATMRDAMMEEQLLTEQMIPALKNGEFVVYYQPQYNYSTSELIGAEALVRWNHPTRGLLLPGAFIPLFERNGLISRLDAFVWEEVCRHMREWMKVFNDPLPVSVNLSRVDIYRDDLFDTLCGLVRDYGIPIDKLRLEITESAYMKDAEKLQDVVRRLSEAGFIIEMDDFGSAYSSLNMLKDIPVDILKLDLKFLSSTDSRTSARGGNILSSVVRMARWLRLPIIAEGVETMEQADYLKSVGCLYMQGFYFARPMTKRSYEKLTGKAARGQMDQYKYVRVADAERFWDASAQTGLLFNKYMCAAALLERSGDKLELIRANDHYFEELGCTRETYTPSALDVWQRFTPESRAALNAAMDEAVKTGQEKSCLTASYSFTGEGLIWIRGHSRLLAKNTGSEMFFVWLENVTELKQTEEKLKRQEQQLTRLYNSVPCGISEFEIIDGRAYMVRGNDTAYKLLGYNSFRDYRDFFNFHSDTTPPYPFILPEDLERMAVLAQKAIETGEVLPMECRMLYKTGGYRWFDVRMQRSFDEEGKLVFQTAYIDIDDRKRAEETPES